MATDDFKPADANKDGKVTPKEREKYRKTKDEVAAAAAKKPQPGTDQQDKLDQSKLEKMFGFAKDIVWKNPQLRQLYKDAIREQYTPEMFQAKLRSTDWYRDNAQSARLAWAAESVGGADWQAQLEEAQLAVEEQATAMGSPLTPDEKRALAKRYIYEGWGDPDRKGLLEKELSAGIKVDGDFMLGAAGDLQQTMQDMARRNGLAFSPSYYESAARSVASGLMTENDFLRDQREQAASLWGVWGDKIRAGMDAEDLASGYVDMMARTMEVDASSISLSDPRLTSAIMRVDDKGNAAPMGLYDFQMSLRADPAWMQTKQATDSVSTIGLDVLQKMGFQA